MFPKVRTDWYNLALWFGWKKWAIGLWKGSIGSFILNDRMFSLFPPSIEDVTERIPGVTWFDQDYMAQETGDIFPW